MRADNGSWQSLGTRLVVGVLCALVPVAGLLGLLWHDRRASDRAGALRALVQTAQAAALLTEATFDDGVHLVRTIATEPGVRSLDPVRISPRLRELQAVHEGYTSLVVADVHGTVLGWSRSEPVPVPAPSLAQGEAQREMLGRTIAGDRPVVFTVPEARSTGALGAGIAAPVRDRGGTVVGLAMAVFDLDRLDRRLDQMRFAPDQGLILFDRGARLVSLAGVPGIQARALSPEERDRRGSAELSRALGGEVVVAEAYRTPLIDDVRLAVWMPTPRYGWVVAANWPVAAALAASHASEPRELVLFGAIAAVLLASAIVGTRSVVRPLRELAAQAERFGRGDFEPIPGIESADEIGRLARSFNAMGARLRQTVADLRGERASLEAIFEQLPVGVVVVAPDGEFIQVSSLAARYLPHRTGDGVPYDPEAPSPFVHPNGRPFEPSERPLARALRDGRTTRGAHGILRWPGQPDVYLSVNTGPVLDPDGRVMAAVQTFEDITAERHASARLHEQAALLRALLDQFPGGIYILDRHCRYVMAAGQRFLRPDLSSDDLTGHALEEILPADVAGQIRAATERAFAGEAVTVEVRGHDRLVETSLTPLRNGAGEVETVLALTFDVTEEHARIERASRDEKLRALGQMAGGIAHDLNQALTLVSGYGELAREALDGDPPGIDRVREMIRVMERAAYDSGETVRGLLTFARGDEQLHPLLVDVGQLLHEVEQLTAPRWRGATTAGTNRVSLQVSAAPGLAIAGSPSALREVLTNLVFNALDAMPNGGGIAMTAELRDGWVAIDVADTGCGMSADVKARVFEPFFTTKGAAGTGLGMAVVFGTVQRHGGQIDIASEPGLGTTIHLRFPSTGLLDAPAPAPAPAPAGEPARHGHRILVVDDEARLVSLTTGMLRRDGHEAIGASSAEDALERLRREPFDLVFSDISMGDGMNGWDLAAAIGREARPVPIILATGWGAGIDEAEARARGVRLVVPKPYRRADLQAAIVRVLADRAESAAAEAAIGTPSGAGRPILPGDIGA